MTSPQSFSLIGLSMTSADESADHVFVPDPLLSSSPPLKSTNHSSGILLISSCLILLFSSSCTSSSSSPSSSSVELSSLSLCMTNSKQGEPCFYVIGRTENSRLVTLSSSFHSHLFILMMSSAAFSHGHPSHFHLSSVLQHLCAEVSHFIDLMFLMFD